MSDLSRCMLAATCFVATFISLHLAVEDRASGRRGWLAFDLFTAWGAICFALILLLHVKP